MFKLSFLPVWPNFDLFFRSSEKIGWPNTKYEHDDEQASDLGVNFRRDRRAGHSLIQFPIRFCDSFSLNLLSRRACFYAMVDLGCQIREASFFSPLWFIFLFYCELPFRRTASCSRIGLSVWKTISIKCRTFDRDRGISFVCGFLWLPILRYHWSSIACVRWGQ